MCRPDYPNGLDTGGAARGTDKKANHSDNCTGNNHVNAVRTVEKMGNHAQNGEDNTNGCDAGHELTIY